MEIDEGCWITRCKNQPVCYLVKGVCAFGNLSALPLSCAVAVWHLENIGKTGHAPIAWQAKQKTHTFIFITGSVSGMIGKFNLWQKQEYNCSGSFPSRDVQGFGSGDWSINYLFQWIINQLFVMADNHLFVTADNQSNFLLRRIINQLLRRRLINYKGWHFSDWRPRDLFYLQMIDFWPRP